VNQLLEIHTVVGNDLATSFYCECPSELFKDSSISHLMKQKITLYGYNDNYFFNEVNKEMRIYTCKCGLQYKYRWTYDGVELEKVKQ
jgi:hypothetical protein